MLRFYKQFLIGIITLFVIGVPLAYFAIKATIEPEPSCFDNLMNQDEEGVDCGGSCSFPCPVIFGPEIQVLETYIISLGGTRYDLAAKLLNPLDDRGSESLSYTFSIYDLDGEISKTIDARDFIMPGEEVFIVASGVELSKPPGKIGVEFEEIQWRRPNIDKPQLDIIDSVYRTLTSKSEFASEATGIVKNNSTFGFESVKVLILVFDDRSDLLAAASSEVNTLESNQARFFKVTWPEPFPAAVDEVRMIARTNIFDEENILRPGRKPGGVGE